MGNGIRNEFTIIWRIENFSMWRHNRSDQVILSPTCLAENLEKRGFYLGLHQECKEYIFCYLASHESADCDKNLNIEFRIEIIDAGGEILQTKSFPKSEIQSITFPKPSPVSKDQGRNVFATKNIGKCKLDWENIVKIDELLNKMQNWTEDTLTIRCHILGEVQTRQPRIECEARTKIGVDRCSYLWKVSDPNITSWFGWFCWSERRVFPFSEQLQVKVTLSAPEDDVLINIQNERNSLHLVNCRMSLVDISGKKRYSQIANYLFSGTKPEVWKFPAFFTKTILEDNKDTFTRHGTLTLTCEFSAPNGINFEEVRYRTLPLINAPFTGEDVSSLQDDWRNMLTSKKHADVKLRVDNEIFPVHKCLLAVRSPVFSAMFDQEMLESRTGIVEIEDLDVKTMKSFLEFLYTGTVDMDYENALKLLISAEKYQVQSLKEKCASILMSILCEENVIEIITLSDMVGHELLKSSSLAYIKSHAGNILSSPQWSQWSENNFKVATEIICMLSTDIAIGK